MSRVFADSGYWLALLDPRDALHAPALSLSLQYEEEEIVSTQMVLVEVLTGLSRSGSYRRASAARYVRYLLNDSGVDIVPQTDEQFRVALERFAARAGQRWSLTDCASFLVMEERGISEALAYDRDFEQAGFTALLRDDRNV